MASNSKIEWTDASWSPVTGCTRISSGCANCFAERMARRLAGRCGYPEVPRHFDVTLHHDRLEQPLKWKKPRRIFVCSMSDLFHKDVPLHFQVDIWRTMADTPHHTYQILTKRPDRMKSRLLPLTQAFGILQNVHIGTSIEDQYQVNKRMYHLKDCPAAMTFVSAEPLLGPLDFCEWIYQSGAPHENKERWTLDWLIIGCESGPKRRPMKLEWAIDLVEQCKAAGIPVFVKQIEVNGKVSHNPDEWPEVLRVREFPKVNQNE